MGFWHFPMLFLLFLYGLLHFPMLFLCFSYSFCRKSPTSSTAVAGGAVFADARHAAAAQCRDAPAALGDAWINH